MKDMYATVSLIVLLLYIVVFIAVIRSRERQIFKLPFHFYIGGQLLWQITGFLIIIGYDLERTSLLYCIGMVGTAVSYAFFLPLVMHLQGRKGAGVTIPIAGGAALVAVLLYARTLPGITLTMGSGGFLVPALDPVIVVPTLPAALMYFIGIGFLVAGFFRCESRSNCQRYIYLLSAALISLVGSMTNLSILQDYPVDIALQGFSAVIIAYALFRYRIVDIRKAYVELLFGLLTFLCVLIVYLGQRFLFMHLFRAPRQDSAALFPEILSFIITIPFIVFLLRKLGFFPYIGQGRRNIHTERASRLGADILRINSIQEGVPYLLDFFREAYQTRSVFIGTREAERKSFFIRTLSGNSEYVPETHPVLEYFASLPGPVYAEIDNSETVERLRSGFEITGPLREFLIAPISSDGVLSAFILVSTGDRRHIVDALDVRFFTIYSNTCSSLFEKTEMLRILEKRVAEKELLLREIHHRVKNNMQVVSSVLNLSLGKLRDERLNQILRDCQIRIYTMANVHEHLYKASSFTDIDMGDYLRSLIKYLSVQNWEGADINVELSCEHVSLDIDRAMYLGMVVTELASNAYKHAFPGRSEGNLWIDIRKVDDASLECLVRDDGIGLPREGTVPATGVGTLVVRGIVESNLKGSWITRNSASGGISHIIRFPL